MGDVYPNSVKDDCMTSRNHNGALSVAGRRKAAWLAFGVFLSVAIGLPRVAHAEKRVSWNNAGGDNEFTNSNNWSRLDGLGAALPGYAPDTNENSNAIIQSAGPCNLNSPFTPAHFFDILVVRNSQTLNINADLNITNIPISVGHDTSADTVNHSNGTVTASSLSINTADSIYNLMGGALALASNTTLSVNQTGTLSIAGGTLTNANQMSFSGDGKVLQTGGLVTINEGRSPAQGVTVINSDMEIHGGTNIIHGQIFVGQNIPVEVKVVGSDAVISWSGLNEGPATHYGHFTFTLDENGVSPINVVTWMSLSNATIVVDGAGFPVRTGGPTNIVLFDSAGYAGTPATNTTYLNFDPAATVEFVHDQSVTHAMYLSYAPPPAGTMLVVR